LNEHGASRKAQARALSDRRVEAQRAAAANSNGDYLKEV
jgi:hypothetical protein